MVSLDRYPCFCSEDRGLMSFTSKASNQQFVKCKNETCGIFSSVEDLNGYMEVFNEKLSEEFRSVRPPRCNHKQMATFAVSKSTKNPGRPYFRCPNRAEEKCSFFQWGDMAPTRETTQNWLVEKVMVDKQTQTADLEMQPRVRKTKKVDASKTDPRVEKKKKKTSLLNTEHLTVL